MSTTWLILVASLLFLAAFVAGRTTAKPRVVVVREVMQPRTELVPQPPAIQAQRREVWELLHPDGRAELLTDEQFDAQFVRT